MRPACHVTIRAPSFLLRTGTPGLRTLVHCASRRLPGHQPTSRQRLGPRALSAPLLEGSGTPRLPPSWTTVSALRLPVPPLAFIHPPTHPAPAPGPGWHLLVPRTPHSGTSSSVPPGFRLHTPSLASPVWKTVPASVTRDSHATQSTRVSAFSCVHRRVQASPHLILGRPRTNPAPVSCHSPLCPPATSNVPPLSLQTCPLWTCQAHGALQSVAPVSALFPFTAAQGVHRTARDAWFIQ